MPRPDPQDAEPVLRFTDGDALVRPRPGPSGPKPLAANLCRASRRAGDRAPGFCSAGSIIFRSRFRGMAREDDGRLPAKRRRRAYSTMRGTAFHLPGPDGPDCPVHVAAGPPVVALAIATWRRRRAWAAVGAGELVALAPALPTAGRGIVIEANGVGPAKEAAARLHSAPHRHGARTRLIHWPGCNHANGPNEEWQERATFAESDGMDDRDAEAATWRLLLPA